MRPMSDISKGDMYAPGYPATLEYVVVALDIRERMVQVQAITVKGELIGSPFWKKNTDRLFNNQVFKGRDDPARD